MNVRGFIAIVRVEKEPIWSDSESSTSFQLVIPIEHKLEARATLSKTSPTFNHTQPSLNKKLAFDRIEPVAKITFRTVREQSRAESIHE